MRYENIHKHTHQSNIMTMDSIIKPEDIAKRAVELGHKTISTVEHGYSGDVFEYYDVAKKYGLKLIYGAEFYYVEDRFNKERKSAHLLILAKNNSGKRQLTKLVSEASKTGFYYRPRIDEELLFSLNPDDVLVTSACIASPMALYNAIDFAVKCQAHFGKNFYLEIQPHTHKLQVDFNLMLLDIHEKYGIELIVGIDTHYIYEEDDKYRTLFLRGKDIRYPEEEGFILDYPDSDTIFNRFNQQGVFTRKQIERAMQNTLVVDDFEDIYLDKEIKMPSIYPNLNHAEKIKKLKEIINKEWIIDRRNIPVERHNEYLEAIRFEMDIIDKTSTEDYFLLNYPIIKRGKELGGVLTRTGRGSAPSFYLNKLLGFTEVDRIDAPITLYPTRFMSVSRILETKSLPDIDFNVADSAPFVQATKEIMGEDNVAWMMAYGTMQDSEAFRNLCRAYDLPKDEFNEVGKDLESYVNHPKWGKIIEESKMFLDVIDSVSPHPCANLLLSQPISEEIGLIRVGDEFCALLDSNTSDKWKYMKNDYLTVTVWKIIADTFKAIGKPIPDVRELTKMVEHDDELWDLYEQGLTITLNQTGTPSGIQQVKQYKPRSIRELSGWVSAIRPAFSSMKHYFLNRKEFSYEIPEFDELLIPSDNFILYQEDIMKTLVYAGFSEDVTYGLLKAIAKKKEGIIEPIHDKFINGFVEKTGNEENALRVWKIIEDAVGYGFNSSHAYSVALDSVYGAYLKAHYPLEYYHTVFNIYRDKTKVQSLLMKELGHFGIKVESILFGKSKSDYSSDKETNSIYKGIASIKYLNVKISEEAFELSRNNYTRFSDLALDIFDNTSIDARQMKILIKLNFFKAFGAREALLEIFLAMINEKKADTERYPEFADRIQITEKIMKKSGEVRKEIKTIKKSLSVSKQVKADTRAVRIENLREYEIAVLSNPPKQISLAEQLEFEMEYLGYFSTTFENIPDSINVVTGINAKHTPIIYMYNLNSGMETSAKIKKGKFFSDEGDDAIMVGDIINIKESHEEDAWKMIGKDDDGKPMFERNPLKQDTFIDKLTRKKMV